MNVQIESPEVDNPWRELWVEWFDYDGEPWVYDLEIVATFCIFCGNNEEYGHSSYCVYPKVKRLLDEEAKSRPDPWHRLCRFWKTALTSLDTYGGESESNPEESIE